MKSVPFVILQSLSGYVTRTGEKLSRHAYARDPFEIDAKGNLHEVFFVKLQLHQNQQKKNVVQINYCRYNLKNERGFNSLTIQSYVCII